MAILQDLIVSVRNLRAELKIEPKVKVPFEVFTPNRRLRTARTESQLRLIAWRMWRRLHLSKVRWRNCRRARSTSRFDVHAIYEKKIDVAAERERLTKELEKIEKELANGQRQTWRMSNF